MSASSSTGSAVRRRDPAALRPQPRRDGADNWPTPACLLGALVEHVLAELPPGPIWEPAAGDGGLARALREAGRKVVVTDLPALDFVIDAPPLGRFAGIVTNPPFNALDAFTARGLALMESGTCQALVLLHRWDHLTASSRAAIFNRAAIVDLCAWRPRWIPGSTTAPRWSFAWVTWRADHAGPPVLNIISQSNPTS